MLSFLFLTYAVIHLGIWFRGWKLWSGMGRPVSLFLVLFGGALLFYDNFRIGSGAMFIAAGAFARSPWSLPIANFGEICITSGFIVSCAHFARLNMRPPRAAPAAAARQAA